MKITTQQLHRYMTWTLPRQLKTAYKRLEIATEADLQATVWLLINRFLRHRDRKKDYRVVCNPYCQTLKDRDSGRGIHPDIVVFKDCLSEEPKAWAIMELKESSRYRDGVLAGDIDRLKKCRTRLRGCEAAYVIFVGRHGSHSLSATEKKIMGSGCITPISVVLDRRWKDSQIGELADKLKRLARF